MTANPKRRAHVVLLAALWMALPLAHAGGLPPEVQAKVDHVKKRLVEMAANPTVVAAVRDANRQDAGTMNNGKWLDLPDTDPAVKAVLSGGASKLIVKWEQDDPVINKILLRDQKGNIVAGSTKPLIFNNASRPVFANAIKGQVWAADEIKPDTTTQVPSVHVSVPVLDGGKPVGVMHAGIVAQ